MNLPSAAKQKDWDEHCRVKATYLFDLAEGEPRFGLGWTQSSQEQIQLQEAPKT